MIALIIIGLIAFGIWMFQQHFKTVSPASSSGKTTVSSQDPEWLQFKFEGRPLLAAGDAYTCYTADRFKRYCTERLAPFRTEVEALNGVVTIDMKEGLKRVEMRVLNVPEDLAQRIGAEVAKVSPPFEEGELEYRIQARKNARQRHMRSIGRWKS